MDCSPPGSSVHGDSPGRNAGVGCHALLQGIFPTQVSNTGLPCCRWISLPHDPPAKPKNTGVGSLFPLQGNFQIQESNWSLLLCRGILYQLSYPGSPGISKAWTNNSDFQIYSFQIFSKWVYFSQKIKYQNKTILISTFHESKRDSSWATKSRKYSQLENSIREKGWENYFGPYTLFQKNRHVTFSAISNKITIFSLWVFLLNGLLLPRDREILDGITDTLIWKSNKMNWLRKPYTLRSHQAVGPHTGLHIHVFSAFHGFGCTWSELLLGSFSGKSPPPNLLLSLNLYRIRLPRLNDRKGLENLENIS